MRFIYLFLMLFTGCSVAFAALQSGNVAYTQAYTGESVSNGKGYAVMIAVTNSAPAAGTFTCATSDICTKSSHGYVTGLKVQVSTTTTLPGGLSAVTDYYVIALSANTFSLASSLVNAQAGTAIDITSTGSGTHTITPTALAGASVKLQGSLDCSVYADIPLQATGDARYSANITATANILLEIDNSKYNCVRAYYTLTAGQLAISQVSRLLK